MNSIILLEEARKYNAGHSKLDTIDFVKCMLNSYNINMKYELLDVDSEVSPGESSDNLGDIGRVVLKTNRETGDYSVELAFECNGLIIDTDTWKVVARPSYGFNKNPNLKKLRKNNCKIFEKYQLFEALDGTTITLYFRDDKPAIGTANGFDVSNYKWLSSDKTYMEMLLECFTANNISMDDFDRNACYNIGFHHPYMHPFANQATKAYDCWLISYYTDPSNPESKQVCYEKNINNIPWQKPLDFHTDGILESLFNVNKASLNKALSGEKPCFGYIVRGDFTETQDQSNLLFESLLLKTIRLNFYNLPNKTANGTYLNYSNRINYLVLKAFLMHRNRKRFCQLFPEHNEKFDLMDNYIKRIIKNIQQCFRQKNLAVDYVDRPSNSSEFIKKLSHDIYYTLKTTEIINVFEKNSYSILYDYITNMTYIDKYMELLSFEE